MFIISWNPALPVHVLYNRITLDHEGPACPEMEVDIISSGLQMETAEEATGLFNVHPVN